MNITFQYLAIACLTLGSILGSYQPTLAQSEEFRVIFYNVENLFDTLDDQRTQDADFTPESDKKWNTNKYELKLKHLSRVLTSASFPNRNVLIGLCEVENLEVVEDLIQTGEMSETPYGIVHKESPDRRGIDVCLVYDKELFEPLFSEAIEIRFPFDTSLRTRDILYVKGKIFGTDTINVFVNHWPSRYGGVEESAPKRNHVASVLKSEVKEIMESDPDARILIMGDLNDEPDNESVSEFLKAGGDAVIEEKNKLIDLMYPFQGYDFIGTYKYKNDWFILDHIIISSSLLNSKYSTYTNPGSANIYYADWLCTLDATFGGTRPFRTYSFGTYIAGFSDHLPVYLDLIHRKE